MWVLYHVPRLEEDASQGLKKTFYMKIEGLEKS
jgi:hypothetical protein